MRMHLSQLQDSSELKKLSYEELEILCGEIRQTLIQTVARRGGHLASNLGVVELTIALHRVFDLPKDRLIFDVGHQSYVHKLLTGRNLTFDTLRTFGGISGFPKRNESEYDAFETGHASTAISAALGMARARDILGEDYQVIALVGDGALTGGMCYEALNDAGSTNTRMIVILNDNEMSIAPNVGALSQHLTDLRISRGWSSTKLRVKSRLGKSRIGKRIYRVIHRAKCFLRYLLIDEGFFPALGFHYYGPIDGHNLKHLEKTLRLAKDAEGPVVIHVLTTKGQGYDKAEEQPEKFHGVPPFYVETGDPRSRPELPGNGATAAQELLEMAQKDKRIVAISAAMVSSCGLQKFQEAYPERVIDVGIAEEHAVTMAAGMAAGGLKPYFAVYATFFQRSYDQMIHDVCMQHLPVTFLIDRAGLSGHDGSTHHGVFDLAQLLPVPGMTVLSPRDLEELRHMVRFSATFDGPLAIRFGRDSVDLEGNYPYPGFQLGRWEKMTEGQDAALLAVGSMVREAVDAAELLKKRGISVQVYNCSTVSPLDEKTLKSLNMPVFTMEEHVLKGGFFSSICAFDALNHLALPMGCFGIPDSYVQHGGRSQLLKALGLLPEQMADVIETKLREAKDGR
ncbi:MAG: 1-deoxy-D-xylulose-5-phosphate synthase [Clostridia bacterium]|nr:1-deoxy-D-xylulose-5-phosphate synthase [Clostridia bacterium]